MKKLRLSVVINTYNRAESLKNALASLKYQTYPEFEVIVVNGPSTDNTEEVIREYADCLKHVKCAERNLSISRNLGIEAASGDIVAFMDDDAIADPNWCNDIVSGYTEEQIAGVGGLVYDHTGINFQYRYSACDRKGDTDFTIVPPFDMYNNKGVEKFLYLQGTNCSFRREYLEKICGFDEEFEYYLDEVDVCMRLVDAGYKIKPLENAYIYHKYMPSFLRNEKKVVLHPYSTVKNKFYFAGQNQKLGYDIQIAELEKYKEIVLQGGKWNYEQGNMNEDEYKNYVKEVNKAVEDGKLRGNQQRKLRKLTMNSADRFIKYTTLLDESEKHLNICFLSKEYPPVNFGGIGRYTYDLATTFASKGHEVHVITEGVESDTVDFEEGVWIHRLVSKLYDPFKGLTLEWNLSLQLRNYYELLRINKQSSIDIVNGPIWLSESGLVNFNGDFPTLLTLMTTQKVLNKINKSQCKTEHEIKLMQLEENCLATHKYIHAISNSILEKCEESINKNAAKYVAPLGCRDLSNKYCRRRNSDEIVIYTVGRLEVRKGVDILLSAAERILQEYDNVTFIWAGKDTYNTNINGSYIEDFKKRNKGNSKILDKFKFLGEVNEAELMQNYADADIVCTPSRYESFGIVLLEAMSFSNAIVATDVGGMAGIINDGVNGVLFENENVNQLYNNLKKLIDDKDLRINLSQQARKDFENKYSLEAVCKNLYDIYIEIINDYHKKHSIVTKEQTIDNYARIIASAENIDYKKAYLISQKVINNPEIVECERYCTSGTVYGKVYKKLHKKFPAISDKIKMYLLPYYSDIVGKGINRKLLCFLRIIYHLCTKIPLVGMVIHYIGNIVALPIRMEQITLTLPELCNQGFWKIECITKSNQQTIVLLKENIDWLNGEVKKINENICDDNEKKFEKRLSTIESNLSREIVKQNDILSDKLNDIKIDNDNNLKLLLNKNNEAIILEKVDDLVNRMHYDIENQRNQLNDSLQSSIFKARSELLFELQYADKNYKSKKAISEIINSKKVETCLKNNNLKLNIGAGHITFDDYVNIDMRKLDGIDIVADIHEIPLDNNSVIEIYASHIIEHFKYHDFVNNILPHWSNLLKEDGVLKIILPDLESMIRKYINGEYSFSDMREVIYGLQEYNGDTHYSLYSQVELIDILKNYGFETKINFSGRKNGKCYDMEIVGIKRN